MKQRLLLIIVVLLTLTACEDTTFRSSVPSYPVGFTINMNMGMYVLFKPNNVGAYLIVNRDGFWLYNGGHEPQHLPRTDFEAYGYAGVLVYVTNYEQYAAFDLCCPHCLAKDHPVVVDGIFATCPLCGESYDLSFGYATPTKGIAKEALRKYTALYSGERLTVRN